MTTLREKIKIALDESRMLILGAQVFLGLGFRSAFEPAFERLPKSSQTIKLVSLVVLLVTIGLLMAPGSYHRIVRAGSDAQDVHDFATTLMDVALIPFAMALSLDFYVGTGRILGFAGGVAQGAAIGAIAIFFWYGLAFLSPRAKRKTRTKTKTTRANPTELKDKIDQGLTESRVVLPGVQALLGFQFITMFMDDFEKLSNGLKYLHMVSLGLMALTMVLLMTPAAYHRLVERGEDTQRFYGLVTGFLIAAMVVLPLGICSEVFIVFQKVTNSLVVSIGTAAALLVFFYGLWFGFTAYRRRQLAET
jgi:hypothetical protein